jgi:hypothetical protein
MTIVFQKTIPIDEFHQQLAAKNCKFLRPVLETTFYDATLIDLSRPRDRWAHHDRPGRHPGGQVGSRGLRRHSSRL